MRYAIFSDVHSNREALQAVLKALEEEQVDKYLCAGDIVGYAADPKECIDTVRPLAEAVVAGNHDWASAGMVAIDYFNPFAKEAVLWTTRTLGKQDISFLGSLQLTYRNEDLTMVHGTLDEPEEFNYLVDEHSARLTFGALEGRVCFLGHSHIAGIFVKDGRGAVRYLKEPCVAIEDNSQYIVNVGSVGQPRDGDPRAAYCVYDTAERQICIKRAGYDVERARGKIIEAGLPAILGDRLLSGR